MLCLPRQEPTLPLGMGHMAHDFESKGALRTLRELWLWDNEISGFKRGASMRRHVTNEPEAWHARICHQLLRSPQTQTPACPSQLEYDNRPYSFNDTVDGRNPPYKIPPVNPTDNGVNLVRNGLRPSTVFAEV